MCTKGFLNYLSVIVVFLNVVFKDEIVKFSKDNNNKKIIIMVRGSLENSLDLG